MCPFQSVPRQRVSGPSPPHTQSSYWLLSRGTTRLGSRGSQNVLPPASAASHTCTSSTGEYSVCDRHSPRRTHCWTRALSHGPTPPLLLPSHNGRSVYTLWCTWCTLSSTVVSRLTNGDPPCGRCPQQGRVQNVKRGYVFAWRAALVGGCRWKERTVRKFW